MRKILSMFIVFLISICNVFGAISKQGIIEAINQGKLGDYLLIANYADSGVQQFLRHSEKHFCDPNDITYFRWLQRNNQVAINGTNYVGNPIGDYHTVLGNGKWGEGATHRDVIRWILNSVSKGNYEFVEVHDGVDLKIKNLRVSDVKQLLKSVERSIKCVFDFNNKGYTKTTVPALNSNIICCLHLNANINGLRHRGNANDGTSGYCYVAD